MIRNKLKSIALILALVFTNSLFALDARAQAILGVASGSTQATAATDLVLVLPFENTSNLTEYNWVGESFADSLAALLNKPGLRVVTNDERTLAYQRVRLPLTVLPSRATAIKLAREVKATMIVLGKYGVTPPQAQAADFGSKDDKNQTPASVIGEARVVRVNEGRMVGDVFEGNWAPPSKLLRMPKGGGVASVVLESPDHVLWLGGSDSERLFVNLDTTDGRAYVQVSKQNGELSELAVSPPTGTSRQIGDAFYWVDGPQSGSAPSNLLRAPLPALTPKVVRRIEGSVFDVGPGYVLWRQGVSEDERLPTLGQDLQHVYVATDVALVAIEKP